MNARPCPACDRAGPAPFGSKGGYELGDCGGCGTLFVTRHPSPERLREIYETYSYVDSAPIPEFIKAQIGRIVDGFAPFRKSGLLLDVGCGAGTLLRAASERGWRASGQEFSAAAVESGKRQGFDIVQSDFLDLVPPQEPFDVIVMIELLEHVLTPAAFIRKAAACLRPGGLLFLTTPNSRSLGRRILGLDWSIIAPPEHLQIFSPRAVRQMFENSGFRRRAITTRGLNPWEFRSHLRPATDPQPISRNDAAFALNERLTRSRLRRAVKEALNLPLAALQLGESIRATATRRE